MHFREFCFQVKGIFQPFLFFSDPGFLVAWITALYCLSPVGKDRIASLFLELLSSSALLCIHDLYGLFIDV